MRPTLTEHSDGVFSCLCTFTAANLSGEQVRVPARVNVFVFFKDFQICEFSNLSVCVGGVGGGNVTLYLSHLPEIDSCFKCLFMLCCSFCISLYFFPIWLLWKQEECIKLSFFLSKVLLFLSGAR